MRDEKIVQLIKSGQEENKELAVVLLQSLYEYSEDEAREEVFNTIPEFLCETFVKIEVYDNTEVIFWLNETDGYRMHHDQDCCESVYVEDVNGDLTDLENEPILIAKETISTEADEWGGQTWTFYKFATKKGYVTIRWHGSSNGYYSERVDIEFFETEEIDENLQICG